MTISIPSIVQLQSLAHDSEITLFQLTGYNPSSPYDSFYFTANDSVVFQGISYVPLGCTIEGMEINSEGSLPRPKLTVSDCTTENSQIITGLIDYYGNDLAGAKVLVTQILRQNLDDGSAPNAAAAKPTQSFVVSQMLEMVPGIYVSFELTIPLELLEEKLPHTIMVQKCVALYRDPIECGYAGVQEWDSLDNPVALGAPTAACGKTLKSCKLRFGSNAVLPIQAFPGMTTIGGGTG